MSSTTGKKAPALLLPQIQRMFKYVQRVLSMKPQVKPETDSDYT